MCAITGAKRAEGSRRFPSIFTPLSTGFPVRVNVTRVVPLSVSISAAASLYLPEAYRSSTSAWSSLRVTTPACDPFSIAARRDSGGGAPANATEVLVKIARVVSPSSRIRASFFA